MSRVVPASLALLIVFGAISAHANNTYRVREGDTVAEISRRLGCSQRALREANRLNREALLQIGQRLRIPGPETERRGPISSNPSVGSIDMAYFLLSNPPVGKLRRLHGPGPRMPRSLFFPTPRNVIGRGYGQGRHGGHRALDLGARMRDRIRAAEEGVVAYAGHFRGYGNCVMLAHPGGAVTVYGHLTRALAHPGRHVRRGQVIGVAGSTGNSTGPHLHFELRVDGRPVDPSNMFESHPVVAGPPPGFRFGPDQDGDDDGPAHGEEIDEDEGVGGAEPAAAQPAAPSPTPAATH